VGAVARRKVLAGVAGAGALALGLAACGGGSNGSTGGPSDGVTVVATTTVLGDVARQVVECGGGEVRTLMPVGADPHDFSPSSADITAMIRADLVIANGLGLEEGLESALASVANDGARVFEVAPLLDPLPFGEDGHPDQAGAEAADEHGSEDPHVWLDVSRMATGASLIGAELADVTGDDAYVTCGEEVSAALTQTDAQVRDVLAAVPAGERILVTDHDAFGYFADAYGFEVAGVVIPGGSTLSQPSSSELADLAQTVRDTGVRAVFANTANPTALVDALANEVGGDIEVIALYEASLGPEGSGAETYQGMMLTNAQLIADGLTGATG
jgi:zinc/manganese transport system substrate-binding protein